MKTSWGNIVAGGRSAWACAALWAYMQKLFGTRVICKANAVEMRGAAMVLQQMGVLDTQTFMSRYTTTIGRTIYTHIDVIDPAVGPERSIMLCVHVHQHVAQLDAEGSAPFMMRYIGSKSDRAMLEAQAILAGYEMAQWLGVISRVSMPPTLSWASELAREGTATLVNYALGPEEIELARGIVEAGLHTIAAGGRLTKSAKVAIEFLEGL